MDTQKLQTIIPLLQQNDILYAGVFGSYARGEQTPASDIDILIKFQKPQGLIKFIQLKRKLSELLGTPVDLVTEKALSPYIKESILKDLRIFYGER